MRGRRNHSQEGWGPASFPRSDQREGPAPSPCEDTMAQPEARLSRDIMTALRARGWFCFKVHGSEYVMAGLPDIIVCVDGKFVGLETKMPDKRDNTSARQDYVHQKILDAGGAAVVVCSVDEAVAACAAVASCRR